MPVLFADATEATKLFANTYLAMRVSYFNEMDSYALAHSLDTWKIIDGVSFDPRTGSHCNASSFGCGGYCLSKVIKQLLTNYKDCCKGVINAFVGTKLQPQRFYCWRYAEGLDNFSAGILIKWIKAKGVEVVAHEPVLIKPTFYRSKVIRDLTVFKQASDVIVSNRMNDELLDVTDKVYTRDLFGES